MRATQTPASAPSVHVLTAVYRDRGAGDKAGVIRHQKEHGAGDVLGIAESADRDAADDFIQHWLRDRAHHLGVDITGRYGVYRDALRRSLLRQRLGEAVDAGLCGGVGSLARIGPPVRS